jgi:hypothetical protein
MKYSTIFREIFDAAAANYSSEFEERLRSLQEETAGRLHIMVSPGVKWVQVALLKDGRGTKFPNYLFGDIVAAGVVWIPSNQRLQVYASGQLGSLAQGTIRYSHEFLEGVPGASPKGIRPFSPGHPIDLWPGIRYLLLAELGGEEHQEQVEVLTREPYPPGVSSRLYDSWPSDDLVWRRLLELQTA